MTLQQAGRNIRSGKITPVKIETDGKSTFIYLSSKIRIRTERILYREKIESHQFITEVQENIHGPGWFACGDWRAKNKYVDNDGALFQAVKPYITEA